MNKRAAATYTRQRGVTLAEMMTVVILVAILTAIAVPNYNEFVQRSRRSEAREALTNYAARQEEYFLDNKTYTTSVSDLARDGTTANGHFTITIPTASTTAYTLRATASGTQANDVTCKTMNLLSSGQKTPTDCW